MSAPAAPTDSSTADQQRIRAHFRVRRRLRALCDMEKITLALANRTGELGSLTDGQRQVALGAMSACLILEVSFDGAVHVIAETLYPIGATWSNEE